MSRTLTWKLASLVALLLWPAGVSSSVLAVAQEAAPAEYVKDELVRRTATDRRMAGPEIRSPDWDRWNAVLESGVHAEVIERLRSIRAEYEAALARSASIFAQDLTALDLVRLKVVQESVRDRLRQIQPVEAHNADAVAARNRVMEEIRREPEATGIPYGIRKASAADASRRYASLIKALQAVRAAAADDVILAETVDSTVSVLFVRESSDRADVYPDYRQPVELAELLASISRNDLCVNETVRAEGLLAEDREKRRSIPEGASIRPVLRNFWVQGAQLTLDLCDESAQQFRLLAQAESQADADVILQEFGSARSTRKFGQRHTALFDNGVRSLADVIAAKCGNVSKESFLAAFAQAIARNTCHATWLELDGRQKFTALSMDESTRTKASEILDQLDSQTRTARASFAIEAMKIRGILSGSKPNERAAAGIHKASKRAVWLPHQTAIAALRSLLDAASGTQFDALLAEARLEHPEAFGASTTDLDKVD